jgi:hypothetical protein
MFEQVPLFLVAIDLVLVTCTEIAITRWAL